MQVAKENGLIAVHALVSARSHVKKGVRYRLINVSKETALMILNGEINSFDKLENISSKDQLADLQILYRIQDDIIREVRICIIEAFYIM